MSFVDLATLSLHRRQEIEARIKVFLGKCDNAIHDIEALKSQASGFVDCLNCDPSELKERFLNAMRQLDEYTYLLTDFNLAISKLDLPNNIQYAPPVQDPTPRPMLTPIFNGNYNLMDALSEPTPSTSKTCANMCPAEKDKRRKIPREEQLLIAFSSASCSSESVPMPYNDTQEKQVQCQIEGVRNLNLDDSACADDLNMPAQSVLQVDQEYPALIMHTDGLTLWIITDDWEEMFNFLIEMTNYYIENAVDLKMAEVLDLTQCVYYDDDSKCYYRALIIRVIEEDVNMAEVFLVDTGEVRCTPVTTIQRLHPRFTRTPPFARCCHLAGIDLSHESKEATEQLVALIKEYIGKRCTIRIDDNSSESLGVYVVLPSGETLNDMVLLAGLAPPIDRAGSCIRGGSSSRAGSRSGTSELDDKNFDITQCPEYDDPVEAVTGYRNRDEMDICKHYKGGPEKSCFKGARCKKRHVMMHPDGWTLDRVAVPARVPTLPLPAPTSWLRVHVSHVAYYDKLYVQMVEDNKPDLTPPTFGVVLPPTTLEQLVQDMNSPASRAAYKPLTMAPAGGELVAALYPPDEQWYRARVLSTTAADQNVEVLYIDYGNIVWVKEDAVRKLEPRWCVLPEQAVRCTLAGVTVEVATPTALAAARDSLVALAKERRLEARVVSRDYNEMTVELYDEQGYSIAEQLLTNPHVKPREYTIVDDSYVKQKIVVP